MPGRLTEIQRRLGDARGRLAALAERLTAVRARLGAGAEDGRTARAERPAAGATDARATLFPGLGVGEDVELTIEVLDTEDPGRNQ